jgi:hypothetical protein
VSLFRYFRITLIPLFLALLLLTTTACSSTLEANRSTPAAGNQRVAYSQIQRGTTQAGQGFGDWVVQAANGLVKDAYVRNDNKLGVVISPQVRPNDVRPLAKSLVQGFQKNFPSRDLTVLMYAPDKKLIMTAQYNNATRQIEYQAAS